MGKKWDYDVPSVDVWREVLRVLKPGGHALIACGTRMQHRMAVNIEDAGFEIRDVITWLYGSGFPKSLDVSKAIDKAAGVEREIIGTKKKQDIRGTGHFSAETKVADTGYIEASITLPASNDAKQWQGWGTALKPACEFWTLARKPRSEKTVATNVLKWGTGAINIDASRIEPSKDYGRSAANSKGTVNAHEGFEGKSFKIRERYAEYASALGRFPANLILDEEAGALLDEQSGQTNYGGASRFFYCAKSSKSERNAGCEGLPSKKMEISDERPSGNSWERRGRNTAIPRSNTHPTVKPLKLMSYLVKLITPPNGVVLDPFMGSGSTGVAALKDGFRFVGIERELEYIKIAEARIADNS